MKTHHYRSCMFLAMSLLAVLSARADNVFTGPGLWVDGTKWSGGKPTSSSTAGALIHGLCAATNADEIIYGPNQWTAIGDWPSKGTTTGRLDVNNCYMHFPTLLYVDNNSEYFQEGGTNYMAKGFQLGYGAGYQSSRMHMKNVDYVYLGGASVFGQNAPDDGGFAEYIQEGGIFLGGSTWTVKNHANVVFSNCAITNTAQYSSFTTGTSSLSFTNCDVRINKPHFANDARSHFEMYMSNTVYTCNYQTYISGGDGGGASSTCRWEMVDCAWTNTGNAVAVAAVSNSNVNLVFRGKNVFNHKAAVVVCAGIDSRALVEFADCPASDFSSVAFSPQGGANSELHVVYRDIVGGTRPFRIPGTSSQNTRCFFELDNARYQGALNTMFCANAFQYYVLNNGASFENTATDSTIYAGNVDSGGYKAGICATNSTVLFTYGTNLSCAKKNSQYFFSFFDSDASIATNATWSLGTHASSTAKLVIGGVGGTNVVEVNTLSLGNGTNDVHLLGNVLSVGQITRSGGNDQQRLHFNGGVLQTRKAINPWFAAGFCASVEDGGAVFDAQHNVTIPGLLRHGGEAAKDGGVVKKGSGKLTLSSTTQEFTGDIVVLDGILDMTAVANYTLATGQKVGGAGTLKVGSGFTAGGVRFDAAWEGGLTVDGDVVFAPGSSVDVTGISRETEGSRFTILTADSISGANCISTVGLPDGWKLRASATSLSIGRDAGLILIVR